MPGLESRRGHEIVQFIIPLAGRGFGLQGREPPGIAPIFNLVSALENVDRLDRVQGNIDGKAARHRVDSLGGIHQQRSLILNGAFNGDSAIGSANHSRD